MNVYPGLVVAMAIEISWTAMAAAVVVLTAAFILAMGLWGVVVPAGLIRFAGMWRAPGRIWLAVTFRLLFAVALWVAAPQAAHPWVFRAIALVSMAAAIAALVCGQRLLIALIDWWTARPGWFIRVWCAVALSVGGYLLWALYA